LGPAVAGERRGSEAKIAQGLLSAVGVGKNV
jgi:hypothetical protein